VVAVDMELEEQVEILEQLDVQLVEVEAVQEAIY
jgi:hypothetical protein